MRAPNTRPRIFPGARFFDIDDISDARSELPHMVPPVEKFMSRLRAMGVGDGHQVVVYDAKGLFSAARVWWLFRLMGQDNIAVLDGGFPKWQAEGRPIEDLPPMVRDRHMTVRRQNHMVQGRDAGLGGLEAGRSRDPRCPRRRPLSRRRARTAEGLRAGHIPGSRNVPYTALLNDDRTMKDPDSLRAVFAAAGVDMTKPVITSCGSGVTAAVINLALERIGKTDHALYDGSWTEWGAFPTLPVATGET